MAETLLWLYGIARAGAPAPGEDVRGIDDAPVRVLERGPLCAIVSEVRDSEYQESALDDHLTDLEWTGARGLAHERVLLWIADRTTVVPLAPFSLHVDESALARRLDEWKDRLLQALDRLTGHKEWGIRIWRDESEFAGALSSVSSAVKEIDEQLASASPGRRYLLQQRRATIERNETARASSVLVEMAVESLSAVARGVVRLQIPPRSSSGQPGATDSSPESNPARTLALHAAFLVPDDKFDDFQRLVDEQAKFQKTVGLDWEFTGPWPAYHFSAF